jgi:hypothetical protein
MATIKQLLELPPISQMGRIARLAAMSILYRDIHLLARSIQQRQAGSHNPLIERSSGQRLSNDCGTFPVNDTSKVPESEVLGVEKLDQRSMDKITCWSALQPNHIEISSMLLTGISIFPPQGASYPTYVDFDAVVKGLEERKSRKRLNYWRKIRQRQDKYQLDQWQHRPGNL